MSDIKINHPLLSYNTFGISATAAYFIEIISEHQLEELSRNPVFVKNEVLILGGGSNILFTKDFPGLILHANIQGIEVTAENDSTVWVKAGSGVSWDEFVSYAVSNDWGGIENLSAIPGSVGAAPVQNIGAYGTEVKDVIEKVEGYDLLLERVLTFSADECHFGYRNSIFKTEYKNRLLITHVYFRLSKPPHVLITKYRNVAEKIDDLPEKTIASMRDLIIRIREAKLPDYRVLGNAGSFFKNPIIHAVVADRLRASFPDVPLYPDLNKMLKVSAAWLIEKSGCKSLRMGNAATHTQQPLVLVNLGSATGKEILALSAHIQKTVKEKFGILLVPEVNIY